MRGEKQTSHPLLSRIQGSPPHARGKDLNTSHFFCDLARNTYLHRNFV